MSTANGKITQKIESYLVTMERLCADIRAVSTASYESTMPSGKVNAVKDKLSTVETKLDELHALMQDAAAASSDPDIVYRSGGGGGK